jgi:cysteine synthase
MKYTSIEQTIGNTPLVFLKKYSSERVKIFAKLEGANPGGSIKDRVALYMIRDAQQKGLLANNSNIIEATSGNTGIGLALVSAIYGYTFTAVMSEGASIERRKLLEMYGAKLILTDRSAGTDGAIRALEQLLKEHPAKYIMLDQYANQANIKAHYEGTGVEIIRDIPEVTHFVAGMGTGGTLMGVGRRLKEFSNAIAVIGIEPKPLSTIQGLRNMSGYVPPIYDSHKLDNVLHLTDDACAFEFTRGIFKQEGISVGISSGAALWGALEVAKTIETGVIVTVFPDRGERYMSTKLFAM